MGARNYSSVARAATLSAPISGSATAAVVSETTGFPTVPFTLVIDPGRTAEEIVTVTAQVGLSLTIIRGEDGTAAVPHDAGATLRHMATARDYRDAADHITQVASVHGLSGSPLGDVDAQVVDNKTFQSLSTDHTPLAVKAIVSQTAPLLVFQEPGGTAYASYTYIGSAGQQIDGSQTIRPLDAAGVPLTVKGLASQTGDLARFSSSSGTVLSRVDSNGKFLGDVTGANIAATTRMDTPYMLVETADAAAIPMNVRVPPTSTNHAMILRNSDTTNARAGVKGPSAGWQMFHGGSSSNLITYKTYIGSVSAVIANGDITASVSLPYSGAGFDTEPLVFTQVRQDNEDNIVRRVSATIEGTPGISSATARVFSTSATTMTANRTFRVWYMAVQAQYNNAVS